MSAYKNMNTKQSLEDAFRVKDITSPEMTEAILAWNELYYDTVLTEERDSSQRIPYIIVDGIHDAAFSEYSYSIDEAGGEAYRTLLDNLDKVRQISFQKACIGGEVLLKPVILQNNFIFLVIPRNNMAVLGRDNEGNISDIITSETVVKSEDGKTVYYTLLERRTLDMNGYCTVQNKLFRATSTDVLGEEVPLGSIPEYASLEPVFYYDKEVGNLGMIPLKMPMHNCVDGSLDGVSLYAAAAGEILKLYKHESRSQDEYDLTAPHLIASRDIQQRDRNGNLVDIPKYITPVIDDDPQATGLTIWNPKPNQVELEARDDQIKRAIENIIGLRRGFLSKSDVQEFTATEIISTTTKMAHLIKKLQEMYENAVHETVRTCSALAKLYGLTGWSNGEAPEPVIEWGNGILYDEDKEFERLTLLTSSGDLRPEIRLGWQFDMPTDTPEDLEAIREKYMPSVNDVKEEEE